MKFQGAKSIKARRLTPRAYQCAEFVPDLIREAAAGHSQPVNTSVPPRKQQRVSQSVGYGSPAAPEPAADVLVRP